MKNQHMAKIWKYPVNLTVLNEMTKNTMSGHLGITFTAFGEDWLEATMPVDQRTRQPMGLLHGGASAVLAEELGSLASHLCLDDISKSSVVGIELTCSHLRAAKAGEVVGRVKAIRIGRRSHVWHIEIFDQDGKQITVSRLTTMVVEKCSGGK